jgi:hypothetical protein
MKINLDIDNNEELIAGDDQNKSTASKKNKAIIMMESPTKALRPILLPKSFMFIETNLLVKAPSSDLCSRNA